MAKKKNDQARRIITLVIIAVIVAFTMYFITLRPDTDLEIVPVAAGPDLSVQPDFNIHQYTGTWFEMARSPNRFEKGCECVTAEYTHYEGNVGLLNKCQREGLTDEIRGTGEITNTPGILKIQFFPFTSSEYRVLYVDERYNNALVYGEQDYWILGRYGTTDEEVAETVAIAAERGLDTSTLIYNTGCFIE